MQQNNSPISRRAFLSAAGAGLTLGRAAAQTKKPNIVIIMADDMGYSDLGCYGSEIQTPNLDKLASGGVRFTQFYNTARCCPTRAALLTGLYQHQAGIGAMVGDLGFPSYQGYLNDKCVTIAEVMRAGGYHTLMAGKWHVGEDRPHWPTDRGFERYFGLISGASNFFRLDPGRQMALNDKPYTPEGDFYMTDAFTDYGLKFLDEFGRKPEPFFLYVPYTSPHWPLHARPADIAKFRGKYRMGWDELRSRRHRRMLELGVVEGKWPLTPRDPQAPAWDSLSEKQKDDMDLRMAVYAAQIHCMDRNIGRLMAKLKELGQDQNTLVMFLADNGGCAEVVDRGTPGVAAGPADSFLSYGLPWANASNTPFRLYKQWVHEGGISSPLIAHWPGRIKPGRVDHQPAHVIDLMATCVDAGGATYPKTYRGKEITPLEGKSLVPIFDGGKRKGHDAIFWEHYGNRAVRQGKWKLVSRSREQWELYDLEADRTELNDLSSKNPAKAAELKKLYDAWAARCGVQPIDKIRPARKKKA